MDKIDPHPKSAQIPLNRAGEGLHTWNEEYQKLTSTLISRITHLTYNLGRTASTLPLGIYKTGYGFLYTDHRSLSEGMQRIGHSFSQIAYQLCPWEQSASTQPISTGVDLSSETGYDTALEEAKAPDAIAPKRNLTKDQEFESLTSWEKLAIRIQNASHRVNRYLKVCGATWGVRTGLTTAALIVASERYLPQSTSIPLWYRGAVCAGASVLLRDNISLPSVMSGLCVQALTQEFMNTPILSALGKGANFLIGKSPLGGILPYLPTPPKLAFLTTTTVHHLISKRYDRRIKKISNYFSALFSPILTNMYIMGAGGYLALSSLGHLSGNNPTVVGGMSLLTASLFLDTPKRFLNFAPYLLGGQAIAREMGALPHWINILKVPEATGNLIIAGMSYCFSFKGMQRLYFDGLDALGSVCDEIGPLKWVKDLSVDFLLEQTSLSRDKAGPITISIKLLFQHKLTLFLLLANKFKKSICKIHIEENSDDINKHSLYLNRALTILTALTWGQYTYWKSGDGYLAGAVAAATLLPLLPKTPESIHPILHHLTPAPFFYETDYKWYSNLGLCALPWMLNETKKRLPGCGERNQVLIDLLNDLERKLQRFENDAAYTEQHFQAELTVTINDLIPHLTNDRDLNSARTLLQELNQLQNQDWLTQRATALFDQLKYLRPRSFPINSALPHLTSLTYLSATGYLGYTLFNGFDTRAKTPYASYTGGITLASLLLLNTTPLPGITKWIGSTIRGTFNRVINTLGEGNSTYLTDWATVSYLTVLFDEFTRGKILGRLSPTSDGKYHLLNYASAGLVGAMANPLHSLGNGIRSLGIAKLAGMRPLLEEGGELLKNALTPVPSRLQKLSSRVIPIGELLNPPKGICPIRPIDLISREKFSRSDHEWLNASIIIGAGVAGWEATKKWFTAQSDQFVDLFSEESVLGGNTPQKQNTDENKEENQEISKFQIAVTLFTPPALLGGLLAGVNWGCQWTFGGTPPLLDRVSTFYIDSLTGWNAIFFATSVISSHFSGLLGVGAASVGLNDYLSPGNTSNPWVIAGGSILAERTFQLIRTHPKLIGYADRKFKSLVKSCDRLFGSMTRGVLDRITSALPAEREEISIGRPLHSARIEKHFKHWKLPESVA